MKTFTFIVKDPVGIHARPAGLLAKQASEFSSNITLKCKGKEADAKKLIRLMALGVKQGDELEITVSGDDEEQATAELVSFLEKNL